MRKTFAAALRAEMERNDRIVLVTGDLGYRLWDDIRAALPDSFVNAGSAEQLMVGLGVGLAMEGKIPVLYSITPFLLYRPFEFIRNYLAGEGWPVKLIGGGRDGDYAAMGPTHVADEDVAVMAALPRIAHYRPTSKCPAEMALLVRDVLYNGRPCYVNLQK